MFKPQLPHRLPRLLLSQLLRDFVADEHKVPAQHLAALGDLVPLGDFVRGGFDVDDQGVFDAEYRVAVLVAVAADVEGAVEVMLESSLFVVLWYFFCLLLIDLTYVIKLSKPGFSNM